MQYSAESLNELVIHYVHSRPELWDLSNRKYKDNFAKKIAWTDLAKELNMDGQYYTILNYYFMLIISFHLRGPHESSLEIDSRSLYERV